MNIVASQLTDKSTVFSGCQKNQNIKGLNYWPLVSKSTTSGFKGPAKLKICPYHDATCFPILQLHKWRVGPQTRWQFNSLPVVPKLRPVRISWNIVLCWEITFEICPKWKSLLCLVSGSNRKYLRLGMKWSGSVYTLLPKGGEYLCHVRIFFFFFGGGLQL